MNRYSSELEAPTDPQKQMRVMAIMRPRRSMYVRIAIEAKSAQFSNSPKLP